jgi:hypothetical protein
MQTVKTQKIKLKRLNIRDQIEIQDKHKRLNFELIFLFINYFDKFIKIHKNLFI